MFFKRKNETFIKQIEERFQIGEKFQSLENSIAEENTQLKEITHTLARLQTSVQKHDMAIEDLLDTWEEKQSGEDNAKKQLHEYEQAERQLLKLFETYQEQFWNLKRFADTKDESWSAQISLMEKIWSIIVSFAESA